MEYQVTASLPISTKTTWKNSQPDTNFEDYATDLIYNWLLVNIPHGKTCKWSIKHRRWNPKGMTFNVTFVFLQEEDATWFKLVWMP